jgi:hypothetical protein
MHQSHSYRFCRSNFTNETPFLHFWLLPPLTLKFYFQACTARLEQIFSAAGYASLTTKTGSLVVDICQLNFNWVFPSRHDFRKLKPLIAISSQTFVTPGLFGREMRRYGYDRCLFIDPLLRYVGESAPNEPKQWDFGRDEPDIRQYPAAPDIRQYFELSGNIRNEANEIRPNFKKIV